jgi:YbgC/YbaW family acyl-CoA thioester hydrolase
MINRTLESYHTIRFPDCDPFNHLNNSKYIDYFINAREDQVLEAVGFNTYDYAKRTGKSWVVGVNQVAYFAPALLMEKVLIQSVLLELNASDVLVEMRMWDENKSKLKSFLWTRFIHFDLKQLVRIEHDEYLVNTFKKYEYPLTEKMIFEQRLMDVKRKAYADFRM